MNMQMLQTASQIHTRGPRLLDSIIVKDAKFAKQAIRVIADLFSFHTYYHIQNYKAH